jgi:predicted ferric reductase
VRATRDVRASLLIVTTRVGSALRTMLFTVVAPHVRFMFECVGYPFPQPFEREHMPRTLSGVAWIFAYLLAAAAPLFFAVFNDAPPARGGWHDFSVALGFIGLAMFGLQFALSARVQSLTRPFGIDVVIQFHRQISYVATAFVVAHPALLFLTDATDGRTAEPDDGPWRARFGLSPSSLVLVLVGSSVWRDRLRLSYETWRVLHGVLAVLVIAFALIHVQLVGYYVSQPWKQVLWAAMSITVVGLLVHVRIVRPLQLLRRRPYQIDDVVDRGAGTWSVQLRPVDHDGLRFMPGQFAWLIDRRAPVRPRTAPVLVLLQRRGPRRRRDDDQVTGGLLLHRRRAPAGDHRLPRRALRGVQPRTQRGASFLFVVGGIGITPVMSMLRTLADRGDRRPCQLLYGVDDLDEVTFADVLAELEETLDLEVVVVLTEAPDGWSGPSGFIDGELLAEHLPDRRRAVQCFVCGPDAMMNAVEQALEDLDVPPAHVNLERFAFA